MDEAAMSFAVEEYKALRAEIAERAKMDHAIQRNAMLVTGAIFSFVFSRDPNPLLAFVLLMIPVVLLVAHFQQARHKAYGMRIGRYLAGLEELMYASMGDRLRTGEIGWEHFLDKERRDEKAGEQRPRERTYWDEVKESLLGRGYSLSATVIDARYLTIGAALFVVVAVGYFFAAS